MLPIGVMMAAVAIVILKTRVLPLWLGLLAAITSPACLINGMFLDAEFGPVFLLWVTIASIVMTLRAGRADARATTSASARPEPAR